MQFITVVVLITLRFCVQSVYADLWVESERISDLQQVNEILLIFTALHNMNDAEGILECQRKIHS